MSNPIEKLKAALVAYAKAILPEVYPEDVEKEVANMAFSSCGTEVTWRWRIMLDGRGPRMPDKVSMTVDEMALRAGGPEWAAAMAVGQLRVAIDLMKGEKSAATALLEAPARAAILADKCGQLEWKLGNAERRIGQLELELTCQGKR